MVNKADHLELKMADAKYPITTDKAPKPGTVKVASQGRVFGIQGKPLNFGSNASKPSGLTVTNSKG